MVIELLTGLHPNDARDLVDDNLFDELHEAICDAHDNNKYDGRRKGTAAARGGRKETARAVSMCCEWPAKELKVLSEIAAGCGRPQVKHRLRISQALPKVKALL
jgi:hypothetical protein